MQKQSEDELNSPMEKMLSHPAWYDSNFSIQNIPFKCISSFSFEIKIKLRYYQDKPKQLIDTKSYFINIVRKLVKQDQPESFNLSFYERLSLGWKL